jgi:glutamate---cysteine ligase / carboxylate-amine ligase
LLDHNFTGPSFTVGIEEELMLLDSETMELSQSVADVLESVPPEFEGQMKPELLQSFLEVATKPHPNVASAGEELVALRRCLTKVAEEHGLCVGAAATHPSARWEDQLVVEDERYERIVEELQYVVRQFLIFGTHVHVGVEGAERAIYIADGIRRYLPLMLALSTNSPFLRGEPTGMMSSRTPVFRALPRAGIPPHFGSWDAYADRVEVMMRAGAIKDYTFLWWDVRPHPNLGTVEVRVFDQQTRVELTVALAALTVCMAHRLSAHYDEGHELVSYPTELVDDNKIRAAVKGMNGVLLDFWAGEQVPAERFAMQLLGVLSEHAQELGCERELAGVGELLAGNTGAHRQLRIWEENPDCKSLVKGIVAASRV